MKISPVPRLVSPWMLAAVVAGTGGMVGGLNAAVVLTDDGAARFQAAKAANPDPVDFFLSDLGQEVPDNSLVGTVSEMVVSGLGSLFRLVEVTIDLEPIPGQFAFNGDMVVTLTHDSGYAVLLNRPGRREDASMGYGDSGFQVTFSDSAASDVHVYRLPITGDHTVSLSGTDVPAPLTGSWLPDGRTVDPLQVLDTSPRTATLSQFGSLDPNGTWTLHVTDLATGGNAQLSAWGLTFAPVPEPETIAWVTGGILLGFAGWRGRARRRA